MNGNDNQLNTTTNCCFALSNRITGKQNSMNTACLSSDNLLCLKCHNLALKTDARQWSGSYHFRPDFDPADTCLEFCKSLNGVTVFGSKDIDDSPRHRKDIAMNDRSEIDSEVQEFFDCRHSVNREENRFHRFPWSSRKRDSACRKRCKSKSSERSRETLQCNSESSFIYAKARSCGYTEFNWPKYHAQNCVSQTDADTPSLSCVGQKNLIDSENSNCNASPDRILQSTISGSEREETETEVENSQSALYRTLYTRLENVQETRRMLRQKASMLLTWNIIQLLVLLLMFMFASTCYCSFRKVFSCSAQCFRKNKCRRNDL